MGVSVVGASAGGTEPIEVLPDVVPAPHAHPVPARTGQEVAVGHIQRLYAERTLHLGVGLVVAHRRSGRRVGRGDLVSTGQ